MTGGALELDTTDITIKGPGRERLTISANGASRVFVEEERKGAGKKGRTEAANKLKSMRKLKAHLLDAHGKVAPNAYKAPKSLEEATNVANPL